MVPFEPFKNKVFKPRRQVPGKRSLPGRPLKAQDPGKRSLPGRPTKASQETCRDAPRVPARPGERQAPGRDKTTTAARHFAAASNHSVPVLQHTHLHVALGPFQAYMAGGCAARGTLWQAALTRSPSWREVASLTVPFLHCLGGVDRHLMPLSPAVKVRYDTLCR